MIVAIVGAECTGKTTLGKALTASLRADGWDAVLVPEHLRGWCDLHRRTPCANEQGGIAEAQMQAIAAAAASHAVVVADTTSLMTAVYSHWVFDDDGLYAGASAAHRALSGVTTLLTALDLPWQPDGMQREGAQVRAPIDALLRTALRKASIDHAVVCGQGHARLVAARAAVGRALPDRTGGADGCNAVVRRVLDVT